MKQGSRDLFLTYFWDERRRRLVVLGAGLYDEGTEREDYIGIGNTYRDNIEYAPQGSTVKIPGWGSFDDI